MQCAMRDLDRRREIERAGQLSCNPQRVGCRCRAVFPKGQVERVGSDVVLDQKRTYAADAGRQRRRQRRMGESGLDQALELGDQLMPTLGRQVERDELDGDKALARGIVRAKDRPKGAGADLVENSKRAEGLWSRVAGSVSVQ
jgi:hypothetical protein